MYVAVAISYDLRDLEVREHFHSNLRILFDLFTCFQSSICNIHGDIRENEMIEKKLGGWSLHGSGR